MNKSVVLKLLGCTLVLGTFNYQSYLTVQLNPVRLNETTYYLNLALKDLETIEILYIF